MTKKIDPDDLRRMYVDEGLTIKQIAGQVGAHHQTVRTWIHDSGIPMRAGVAAPATATESQRESHAKKLARLQARSDTLQDQIANAVADARKDGVSWGVIASAMGLPTSSVQERFSK